MSMAVIRDAKKKPFVRRPFFRHGYPMEVFEVSRTQQSHLKSCDINNIIKRYKVTGLMPQHSRQPMYGDFSNMPDYQGALNIVLRAENTFASLSSDIREKFGNDVEAFLAFAQDPENADTMRDWGFDIPKPDSVAADAAGPAPAVLDAKSIDTAKPAETPKAS